MHTWHPLTLRHMLRSLIECLKAHRRHKKQKKKGLRLRNPLFSLVGGAGFEPATNGLKVRCSTN
jgi:hypothetical protein